MGPDFRILINRARKIAMEYEMMYGEEIPTTQLVTQTAAIMQEYTQSGYEWCLPLIYFNWKNL